MSDRQAVTSQTLTAPGQPISESSESTDNVPSPENGSTEPAPVYSHALALHLSLLPLRPIFNLLLTFGELFGSELKWTKAWASSSVADGTVLFETTHILWFFVGLHDGYMLSFDFFRMSPLGSVFAQLCVGLFALAGIVLELLAMMTESIEVSWASFGLQYLPWILVIVCSFSHVAIVLVAAWPLRRHMALWEILRSDAKALMAKPSLPSPPLELTAFGCVRNPPLSWSYIANRIFTGSCRAVGRFFKNLVFRRVIGVESKTYAACRNGFAILALAFILFRAATALSRASNEFDTHMLSESCRGTGPLANNIQVVMKGTDEFEPLEGFGINVTAIFQPGQAIGVCVSETLPAFDDYIIKNQGPVRHSWFTVFNCTHPDTKSFPAVSFSQTTYNIKIWSLTGTQLSSDSMPRIWFSDSTDTFIRAHPPWGSSTFKGAAPWLTSAWRLVPGSHLSAEVGHITRKFISSSIWRDTITQLKPSYVEVALFPIATTQTVPFLAGNTSIATGIITPSLRTSYTAFKSKALFDPSTLGDSDLEACDYIEDVRSHTILDVVGSIGGLFALLQFLHVFLFGRPMLWGLTGAKLITPFGFCGSFGSQSFRRRLRDNYYSTPSGGTDETLRVDAFMRDFVIDLGPAATDASTAGGCSTGTAQRQSDVEANTSGVDHQSTTAEVDTSVAHNR